jgi:hypothetical protein
MELSPGKLNLYWSYAAGDTAVKLAVEHNLPPDTWVGVGLPPTGAKATTMVGSEVAIHYYNAVSGRFALLPYRLSAKSQCDYTATAVDGVCPSGKASFALTGAATAEGVTNVTFTTPVTAVDASVPSFDPSAEVYLTWAFGPILTSFADGTPTVGYHRANAAQGTKIRFASTGTSKCTTPVARPAASTGGTGGTGTGTGTGTGSTSGKLPVKTVRKADGAVLKVTVGENPNYPSPEGGWGVSLWIDGDESPVIEIVRGSTVTFSIQATAAHPVYLTTSEVGGDPATTGSVAGGTGIAGTEAAPATFEFKTDKDTPALHYYPCSTHRRLGWKIMIVDPADESDSSSAASIGANAVTAAAAVTASLAAVLF